MFTGRRIETKWTIYRKAFDAERAKGTPEDRAKDLANAARINWETARATRLAAEKADKQAKAMTCQICGRQIFAELGTVAHHGYERPGHGWQTSSCFGAKRLPYETSRDAIEQLIPGQKAEVARLVKYAKDIRAEREPVRRTFKLREDYNMRHVPLRSVEFTRETFPYALYFARAAFEGTNVKPDGMMYDYGKGDVDAFAYYAEHHAREVDGRRKQVASFVKYLEGRRDAWKLTHKWDAKLGWRAV